MAEREKKMMRVSLPRPLISAEALRQEIAQGATLTILDCRASLTDPGAGIAAWMASHIPGSVHFDLHRDMAGAPGAAGRFPLPNRREFVRRLHQLGIHPGATLVVVDDAGGTRAAARAWWLLHCWAGHPDVRVLDGGLTHWIACGRALASGAASTTPFEASDWTPDFRNGHLISAEEILANPHLRLTDGRSRERYSGAHEPLDDRAGHIPGAVCRPCRLNLTREGVFKAPDQLRAELISAEKQVVAYCGGGVAACHTILAYRVAGLALPRLYIGSWSHWIQDPTRPVSVG
ncbi:sulfurtransferase [Billgrantia endophytica]|nr:rhodanese-like domain-containing protein [Halomonas endophytica]